MSFPEGSEEETVSVTDESGVEALGLSAKITEALQSAGLKTVADLKNSSKEQLLEVKGVGKKTVEKILALIGSASAEEGSDSGETSESSEEQEKAGE